MGLVTNALKKGILDAIDNLMSKGVVSGSDFPLGTSVYFTEADGDFAMTFKYPNGEQYIVTHDNVKSAEVLAMGVVDIEKNNGMSTKIYGTKYKLVLNDGKAAVLTVGLGETLNKIEHIIF